MCVARVVDDVEVFLMLIFVPQYYKVHFSKTISLDDGGITTWLKK